MQQYSQQRPGYGSNSQLGNDGETDMIRLGLCLKIIQDANEKNSL
jgi:hypothetical protein